MDGVIAHRLIFGAGVAGPEIEEIVVRGIATSSKGESGETGHSDAWRRGQFGEDVDFDSSIVKLHPFQKCKTVLSLSGQANRFPPAIFYRLGLDSRFDQVAGVGQREASRGRGRGAAWGGLCGGTACGK